MESHDQLALCQEKLRLAEVEIASLQARQQNYLGLINQTSETTIQLSQLSRVFLGFGADPVANIQSLIELTGSVLQVACAFYHHLKGSTFTVGAQWCGCKNAPVDIDMSGLELLWPKLDMGDVPALQPVIVHDLGQHGYDDLLPCGRRAVDYCGLAVVRDEQVVGVLSFYFNDTFAPHDFERDFIGIIAVAVDVEERRLYDLEVQSSHQALLCSITDNIPDIILRMDGCGLLVFANSAGESYYRRPIAKLTGKLLQEIDLDPVAGEEDDGYVAQVLQTGEMIAIESSRVIDGESTILNQRFFPERDAKGQMIGVVCLREDITEQKQMAAAVRRQSAALEQAFDGVAICDNVGQLLFANRSWAKMHGYQPAQLIGMQISDFMVSPQGQGGQLPFAAAIHSSGGYTSEAEHLTREGCAFPVQISVAKLCEEPGHVCGFVVIAADRCEQQRLKEQLGQAQQMEAIGRLAGGLAHDINNMLSPIVGFADLIEYQMQFEDPVLEHVRQIRQLAFKAGELIKQLLDFSRKQPLQIKTVDLNWLLSGLEVRLQQVLRGEISLRVVPSSGRCLVLADSARLSQVVMHLVTNAQEAILAAGKIEINCEVVTLTAQMTVNYSGISSGEYVRLAVSDNGRGFDQKLVGTKLFEPYYTTKKMGGGLGLSICMGIVKQHGGHISVVSVPGAGTEFRLLLPCSQPTLARASVNEVVDQALTGCESVLIVEDDTILCGLMVRVLVAHGYLVSAAASYEECQQMVVNTERRPDLLVADVVLPEHNGRELYAWLQGCYPDLKVLYVSGHSEDLLLKYNIVKKLVSLLAKPFSIDELLAAVRATIDT